MFCYLSAVKSVTFRVVFGGGGGHMGWGWGWVLGVGGAVFTQALYIINQSLHNYWTFIQYHIKNYYTLSGNHFSKNCIVLQFLKPVLWHTETSIVTCTLDKKRFILSYSSLYVMTMNNLRWTSYFLIFIIRSPMKGLGILGQT